MPKSRPSPVEPPPEGRGSIKPPKTVADRFYASAAAHGETAGTCLTRLLDAAASTDSVERGSIENAIKRLTFLEEQQSVSIDAALSLSACLVSLSARLDDGGAMVAAKLATRPKGGKDE